MTQYVARRILASIPVLAIVAIVTFFVIHLVPGNPAAVILGPSATVASINHLTRALGLDKPLPVQFYLWLKGVLHGNFGYSVFLNQSVLTAVTQHIWPTLWLSLSAELISIAFSFGLGMVAAWYKDTAVDKFLDIWFMTIIAIPDFILALELVYVFGVVIRAFPVSGYVSPSTNFLGFLHAIALPALVLGLGQSGIVGRVVRDAIVGASHNEYVRVATAKGLSRRTVFIRHTLRSSLLVPLTMIGSSFATLLSGVVILESVFDIPGLGWLAINSILNKDYPTVQAVVLLIATTYVVVNLLVDVSYFVVDPRTRTIYQ